MTQAQLDHAVADATGETVATIHLWGFSPLAERPDDLEPEDLALCVACPHCRRAVAYPGAPALAECLDCDVYFAAEPAAVFAAAPTRL